MYDFATFLATGVRKPSPYTCLNLIYVSHDHDVNQNSVCLKLSTWNGDLLFDHSLEPIFQAILSWRQFTRSKPR